MEQPGTTTALVNLEVDGSGFEAVMAKLLRLSEELQNRLKKVVNEAGSLATIDEQAAIKNLARVQSMIGVIEKTANTQGASASAQLKVQKEINAEKAKGLKTDKEVAKERLSAENKIRALRQDLKNPEFNQRAIFQQIDEQKSYISELGKRETALNKLGTVERKTAQAQLVLDRDALKTLQAFNSEKARGFTQKQVTKNTGESLARTSALTAQLQTAEPGSRQSLYDQLATEKKFRADLAIRQTELTRATTAAIKDQTKATKELRDVERERLENSKKSNLVEVRNIKDVTELSNRLAQSKDRELSSTEKLVSATGSNRQKFKDEIALEQSLQKELSSQIKTTNKERTDSAKALRAIEVERLEKVRTSNILEINNVKELTDLSERLTRSKAAELQASQRIINAPVGEKQSFRDEVVSERLYQSEIKKRSSLLSEVERTARTEQKQTYEARLQTTRTLNTQEIKSITDLSTLQREREGSLNKIRIATETLNTNQSVSSVRQQRQLNDLIKTENLRLAAIKAQERAINQVEAARQREIRQAEGPKLFGEAGAVGVVARTAGYAAAGTAIYAVAGAAATAAQFVVEFDEKIAKLAGISGSTAGQMEILSDKILQVAKNSAFSTIELVEASTLLAQSGFSASEIGDALQASSNLAIASGSSIADSVDLVTSAIGSFQLQTSEAARIADSFVASLNGSKLSLEQLRLGIQYAGATAYESGLSLEELNSTFAALAQAGVRSGSTQGTGTRQLLVDLQAPSEKLSGTLRKLGLDFADIDVKTLGLVQVLKNLAAAGFGNVEAFEALETRAAAQYVILKNSIPFQEKMNLLQLESGSAAESAGKAQSSLTAEWQRYLNILSTDIADFPLVKFLRDRFKQSNDLAADPFLIEIEKRKDAQLAEAATLGTVSERLIAYRSANTEALEKSTEHTRQITILSEAHERYASELERTKTRMAEAGAETESQQSTLRSLDEAIDRVIARSGSLTKGSIALQTETAALSNRFEGLAEKIDMSTNSAGGLVAALQNVKAESAAALADLANAEKNAAKDAALVARKSFNLEKEAFKRAGLEKRLTGKGQAEVYQEFIQSPGDFNKRRAAADLAQRLPENSSERVGLNNLIEAARSESNSRGKAALAGDVEKTAAGYATAAVRGFTLAINKITSTSKPSEGKDLLTRLDKVLADPNLDSGRREGLLEQRIRLEEKLRPTQTLAEEKAPRTTSQPRLVARKDLVQAIAEIAPELIEGSGYRSQGQQNSINSPGKASKSLHTYAIGQDFRFPEGTKVEKGKITLKNGKVYTEAELRSGLESRGISPDELKIERGPRYGEGTGPHLHTGLKRGKRFTKENESDELRLAKADRDEELNRILKNEKIITRRAVTNSKEKLSVALETLSASLSEETFEANKKTVETSFKEAEEALRRQAEVDGAKMNEEELKDLNIELEKTINLMAQDTADKISESLTEFLQSLLDQAERAMAEALRAPQEQLRLAEARVAGLDRLQTNGGFVPDYVRSAAQQQVTQAQESLTVARQATLPSQINAQNQVISLKEKEISEIEVNPLRSADDLKKANAELAVMTTALQTLKTELSGLEISSAAVTQIPTTVSGNINLAISEWQRLRGVQKTWAETVGSEVGPALDYLEGSLNDVFNNLANGSRTALQAFGDLAKGIIKYIQQLVIKIIASKIIDLLASAFGAPSGGKFNGGSVSAGSTAGFSGGTAGAGGVRPLTLRFHGGPAPKGLFNGGQVPGFMAGGRVSNGYPGRDSVNAKLAKDEFVVRSASVKSVGVDFMNDLNKNGARALEGLKGVAVIPTPARQETNVFVVKPDAAPTMGPNDVLVTIHEDILRNGHTKRLIKHVAQGG